MSQQLNLQAHLICIYGSQLFRRAVLRKFIRKLEVSSLWACQKFNEDLLKAAHCFQVKSCARFYRLRNFGGFRTLFGRVPSRLHPCKGKKAPSSRPPYWFPGSAVGLQPIWHQVKASRWESLSLVLWVSGSWPVESSGGGRSSPVRLAPGERQRRWAQWAQVVPVQTRVHQVRGVSAAQQVLSPAPLTLCMLLHIKPSTWDEKQQVPHASHPSALRNVRSRSRELPPAPAPAVYLLRVLGVSEEEDEERRFPARFIHCHHDIPLKSHALEESNKDADRIQN